MSAEERQTALQPWSRGGHGTCWRCELVDVQFVEFRRPLPHRDNESNRRPGHGPPPPPPVTAHHAYRYGVFRNRIKSRLVDLNWAAAGHAIHADEAHSISAQVEHLIMPGLLDPKVLPDTAAVSRDQPCKRCLTRL
jgi:hypothetical protein